MFDEHTLIFVASKIEISYKVKKEPAAWLRNSAKQQARDQVIRHWHNH